MRALLSAMTLLAPLMAMGCTLFNGPTPVVLKRCVVIGDLPIKQPLSVLEKALTADGASASWQRGQGRTYLLRLTKTNQLSGKTDRIALEIDQSDNGATGPECGPGAAVITQLSINGEIMGMMLAQDFLIPGVEKYLGHKLGQSPVPAPPASSPPATEPPQTVTNNEMEAEVEADREFYESRAAEARSKPIRVVDHGVYYCCLTVGQVFDDLRARKATATIDTFDDGTISIDARSPTTLWLAQTELRFEFKPFGNGGSVELSSIKAGPLEVASSRGDTGIPAASYLTSNFKLSQLKD